VSCERVAEVVKVLKWKRRVLDFTVVAKKRSYRVLLLFGADRVEKLWNILIGKAVGELCSKSSGLQGTIKTYREFVSVVTKFTSRECSELPPLLLRLTRNFLTTDFLKYRKFGKESNLANIFLPLLNFLAHICNTLCHIDQQVSHTRQK